MKDVHTEHCCVKHGCKYAWQASTKPHCTVESGEKKQSYPCEICDEEISVDSAWAYLMNEMFDQGRSLGWSER
jgi:hypothetical protein